MYGIENKYEKSFDLQNIESILFEGKKSVSWCYYVFPWIFALEYLLKII